jgi:recombination protein RecA
VPAKPIKTTKQTAADGQPAAVNIYHELARHLSTITGKIDSKLKGPDGKAKVILPPAEVLVAGDDSGEPMIRLPGVIPTGSETLDAAIGVGGYPMARLTVLTGSEGCGKTTLCGHAVASVQKMGGLGIYIDNEFKLDSDYFRKLGVDLRKLLVTSPATVEDSFAILNEMLLKVLRDHPGVPILGVLDSLNATKSEKEYEEDGTSDFTESNQGGLGASARFQSANLPKLLRVINRKPVSLIFISQPRQNIGSMGRNKIAGGGDAPKYYAALAIELARRFKPSPNWVESDRTIGSVILAKCFKNQVAKQDGEAEIHMRFGSGVDYSKGLLDQATKIGLLNCSKGHYEMPTDDPDRPLKWAGLRGWHKLAQERPDVLQFMVDKIREPYVKFQGVAES